MKPKIVILVAALLTVCGFLGVKLAAPVKPGFSFSFPLHAGKQEIITSLPPGRYALVISTNYGSKTFSEIPPQRDYSSQIIIQVHTDQRILARGSNSHYLVFSIRKESDAEAKVKLTVDVQKKDENETLVLILGRGF
jgi:hypothetical protein